MAWIRGSVVVLFALVAPFAPAEAKEASDGRVVQSPLGEALDHAVQTSTGGGFWGAILVARKDQVLLAKAYGNADYRNRPNTTATLFEIASASKPFTSAAILKLQEQGKVNVGDPLSKFFPDIPEDKRDIRLLQLMTHTSGIWRKAGVPYHSTIAREQYVPKVLDVPRKHKPGQRFEYNNAGYALLAAIVEVASGASFEDYCHEHLFTPAGMAHTGFIQDKRLADKPVAHRLGVPGKSAHDWHWGWGYRGMGGIVTNVHDLYRWHVALRDGKVLNKQSLAAYYRPLLNNYALGWQVEQTGRDGIRVSHGGGVQGFRCMYERDLGEDSVIVVLSNSEQDPTAVAKTIRNTLHPPPRVTASIDTSGYELTSSRAAEVGSGAKWDVGRDGKSTTLTLQDGDKRVATIRVPPSLVARMLKQLDTAIRVRSRDDEGKPAAVEGGVYLAAYPKTWRTFDLDEELRIRVLPEYVGVGPDDKRVVDKRVVFVLSDAKHRMWPVMLKMNVAAAKQLRALFAGGK